MSLSIEDYHRGLLVFEYEIIQYETLIQKDPVRFDKLQIPLRESKEKIAKIEKILKDNPENPITEEGKLQLKRYIIQNELRREEGGRCLECSYYLPNRLRAEHGYIGMMKKLEAIPEDTIACSLTSIRMSQPTLASCDMYAEDLHALRDDDLRKRQDRIAAWLFMQAKYDSATQATNQTR